MGAALPASHLKEEGEGLSMKRSVIFWATVAAGAVAAYLMFRRGESLGTIARETVQHPVGSLIHEAQNAAS